ncbi:mechanosensitive ion channel family protein [Haloglomus litoreum]|uniref:mechanosensitive ion channel family protein n=1 Tax=Haloglomus litoreum TaxID=3034026 RepID=UPI0023E85EFB|nr:mechanosensitive ion channel domain-containing protein [Haloglomus sp. DT116]
MFAQLQPPGGFPDPLAPYSQFLSELLAFLVAVALVYALGRLLVVPFVLRVVRGRNRNNPTLVTATETYVQVLLIGIALLAGLVAAGQLRFLLGTDSAIIIGALAFAFSVAGQEVFGSLISGFFLVADPDFNVGDFISWSGGEGVVEAVDFRVTRIRTPDNETITVPNTELTTNALTRPFGRDNYRITERAFVSYAEDTEHALMELQQIAANFDRVVEEPAPNARIVDLGPDSITVRAELWVDEPARVEVADIRSDFRREVKLRFDEEDLTLAPAAGRELSGSVAVERPE